MYGVIEGNSKTDKSIAELMPSLTCLTQSEITCRGADIILMLTVNSVDRNHRKSGQMPLNFSFFIFDLTNNFLIEILVTNNAWI